MTFIPVLASLPDLIALRHDLHANPELGFCEHRTAGLVASRLRDLGLEVTTGIGGTGVVATLRHGTGDGSLGFRADMDALPFDEEGTPPYASRRQGAFHGCGHDGHTVTLLGAAEHLATTRCFSGTIHFIFQPAEEGLGGARAMVSDGLFERFPCDQVFALHNWPDLPLGAARSRRGAIMASADKFRISLTGVGGHAAMPHTTPDAILAAAALVTQLNTIVSRRVPATSSAVLSVTKVSGGHAHNVIPAHVEVMGTVRTFDPEVQDRIENSIREIAAGVAIGTETQIAVEYDRYYPATINDDAAAESALAAAHALMIDTAMADDPAFTSEDFAFMLRARPGAYLWLGQGDVSHDAPLHHPRYDFNDRAIPLGIGWFATLAEQLLPLG